MEILLCPLQYPISSADSKEGLIPPSWYLYQLFPMSSLLNLESD